MDIYAYIKKDHKKVSTLFKKIESDPKSEGNQLILDELIEELTLHADTEQATFYNALKKTAKGKEMVGHAIDEHKEIKQAIKKITKLPMNTPEWWIALGEFKAIVEHHVEEEETEIFTIAKKILPASRAKSLVLDMDEMKEAELA